METKFTKNIDECVSLFKSKKVSLTTFVKKNFKEGVHFIETKQTEKNNQLNSEIHRCEKHSCIVDF